MLAPLLRELMAAEQPVLDAHGLSMWGYVVLLALDQSPMRTQAALAEAIGADKTRIIPTLDELQGQGFIERRPTRRPARPTPGDHGGRPGGQGRRAGRDPAGGGTVAWRAVGRRAPSVPKRAATVDASRLRMARNP